MSEEEERAMRTHVCIIIVGAVEAGEVSKIAIHRDRPGAQDVRGIVCQCRGSIAGCSQRGRPERRHQGVDGASKEESAACVQARR